MSAPTTELLRRGWAFDGLLDPYDATTGNTNPYTGKKGSKPATR